MLLMLLLLGCNRSSCESKTLTRLAEAQCEAFWACPEFAPRYNSIYEDVDACVQAVTTLEAEFCISRTIAPCNGKLVPARAKDCAELYRDAMVTCEEEPRCTYVDSGFEDNGIYKEVDWECIYFDE